jgi:acetylglutamate kinase
MQELLVVKIGGNIIDDDKQLFAFLNDFAAIAKPKILVHGGGKLATEVSAKLGIETNMIHGRRVTDEPTLKTVTMTYAGWINKSIVAKLQSISCNAIGLCGADAKIIPSVKRPVKDIDYGYVGDILGDEINSGFLSQLLMAGIVPVIAPISFDASGQLLNVNADGVATSLAVAMSKLYETTLSFCFEKKGLLKNIVDENSVINLIREQDAERLKADNTISQGMIPKVDNAFLALHRGVERIYIAHASFIKHIAAHETGYGTCIVR